MSDGIVIGYHITYTINDVVVLSFNEIKILARGI